MIKKSSTATDKKLFKSKRGKKKSSGKIVMTTFVLVAFMITSLGFFELGRWSSMTPLDHAASSMAKINRSVVPGDGLPTGIVLGSSIANLIDAGAIDREKFQNLYASRGGLSAWQRDLLDAPSDEPLVFTRDNAQFLLNILWPIGIANAASFNEESRLNSEDLPRFASTGGWSLGKADNGAEYFNKHAIAALTPEQSTLVRRVAENIYRPCCNNHAFFQDCNHGSAMLGLLELGASQGLDEDELYSAALAANSFWFPDTYLEMAFYFDQVHDLDWTEVDPKLAVGGDFANASGSRRVKAELASRSLLPQSGGGGGGCGV